MPLQSRNSSVDPIWVPKRTERMQFESFPPFSVLFFNTFECMSPYRLSENRTVFNQNSFDTDLSSKNCRMIEVFLIHLTFYSPLQTHAHAICPSSNFLGVGISKFLIFIFVGKNLKNQKFAKFKILFSGNVSETYSPFFNTVKVLSKNRFDAERTNVKNHCKL